MSFQRLSILCLVCWLLSSGLSADEVVLHVDTDNMDNMIVTRFSRGFEPVLWYLEIRTRPSHLREWYFDDLVPEFCLYGDGTLIYRDKLPSAAGKWKRVKINQENMKEILDRVQQSRITSYDPMKMPIRFWDISGSSTTVIGVRLQGRHPYVQEVSISALPDEVERSPEIEEFKQIFDLTRFLEGYQHPDAENYRPEVAELSIVEGGSSPAFQEMTDKVRQDTTTRWERFRKWNVSGVDLRKTEKRGWHHVLELEGKEIADTLEVLDLGAPPKACRYKGRLYFVQYRPLLPRFPRERTYLPFPEMIAPNPPPQAVKIGDLK